MPFVEQEVKAKIMSVVYDKIRDGKREQCYNML